MPHLLLLDVKSIGRIPLFSVANGVPKPAFPPTQIAVVCSAKTDLKFETEKSVTKLTHQPHSYLNPSE